MVNPHQPTSQITMNSAVRGKSNDKLSVVKADVFP